MSRWCRWTLAPLLALLAATLVAAPAGAGATLGGTFSTRLSGASPAFLNGPWRVTFGPRGQLTTRHVGEVVARGTYATLAGQLLRVRDRSGPVSCTIPADRGPATYRWRLQGRRLTLTALHDRCGGRQTVLTTHPLTKV